jgi:hypothetical protein
VGRCVEPFRTEDKIIFKVEDGQCARRFKLTMNDEVSNECVWSMAALLNYKTCVVDCADWTSELALSYTWTLSHKTSSNYAQSLDRLDRLFSSTQALSAI